MFQVEDELETSNLKLETWIMSDREEFLTAKQLAEILQVSESTVRRLAQKRRIPSVRLTPRIIRFHLDAVREALDVPRVSSPHRLQTDDAQLSFEDLLSKERGHPCPQEARRSLTEN